MLEYGALRELLRGYVSSPLGGARLAALAPSLDRAWIVAQHALTAEIRAYRRAGGRFEFAGLIDPQQLALKARIAGSVLEPTEIRDLLQVLERAAEWRDNSLNPPVNLRGEWRAVPELSAGIVDFNPVLRFFRGKILPDGSLDDKASPELGRIRREIDKQRRVIEASLRANLRKLSDDGVAQDELITIRGDRFVIPVKVEQRRRVPGVVHGASSSGQTVFVEPMETIEQNNELVRLFDEEQGEIHRILLEMTRQLGTHAEEILRARDVLAELELQTVKARFAEDYDCVMPVMLEDRSIAEEDAAALQTGEARVQLRLALARHPLLERNLRAKGGSVVPLSLELLHEAGKPVQRQLVISGPNTGGKTVGLKTLGLLALMAQSGIPVPADRADLPIFDAVHADIGDYQSIEQNLSTFSAHVTNINYISRVATAQSLVLLDELGSATDPEEGSALAVAIADHFRRIGAMSVISTHHTSLKVYAENTPGVVNAAVGFDEATLQPTYELRIGVPGASAGVNIAQRLGLNPEIIAASRARLSTQTQDVAKFLERLHTTLRELEMERGRMSAREVELEREKTALANEGRRELQAKTREMEKKLDSLLRDFEYHAREAVSAVQERAAAQKLSKDAERRVAKLRREFREQFDQTVVAHTTGADVGDPNAQPQIVKHVSEGDVVKLKSTGQAAVVKRMADADTFEVEMGAMKMRMKIRRDDIAQVLSGAGTGPRTGPRLTLTPVEAARARGISVQLATEEERDGGSQMGSEKRPGASGATSARSATTKMTAGTPHAVPGASLRSGPPLPGELNVIGRTVDEATSELERYLDRAFLAGLPRVRVIHGHGMGVLRRALREFLRSHPHVEKIAEAPQNEGGAGATLVELRG